MAHDLKTPGVYVREIRTLPASVAAVATAIPAFIGYTEKAEKDGESLVDIPTRIRSYPEFVELFGGPEKETGIDIDIDDSGPVRVVTAKLTTPSDSILNYALRMYFANGGGPCWIVSVDTAGTGGVFPSNSNLKTDLETGLDAIAKEDEPTLLVMPEAVNLTTANQIAVMDKALKQCNTLQDRFTIMDVQDTGDITADANDFRNETLGNLKYGAAYYPNIKTLINFEYDDEDVDITNHVLDGSTGATDYLNASLDEIKDGTFETGGVPNLELYNQILAEINKLTVTLPPSSSVAGIYARVDRNRGVWKAPANVTVSNILGPNTQITREDQADLNVDATSGKSINAIRAFAGKGTLVWGARTLAGNDNEWRYVPVRRLYIFVEESTKKATEFVVFEPNDANTWLRVKTMIENFLTTLWRDGALAGGKPEDAFFVNVGLGITMTPQDILNGIMNVEIGLAAVRPAEFIVLKFSHKLQQS